MDDLDLILASGDDEAIEKALADMGDDAMALMNDDSESSGETTPPSADNDVKTDPEASPAADESGEAPKGYVEKDGKYYVEASDIASKNGKHSLPYDVLEQSRAKAASASAERDRLAQEKQALEAQLAEHARLQELYKQQLAEAQIDPKKLPEQMVNDPELLARIREDYPELGDVVALLAEQTAALRSQGQAAPAQAHPQDNGIDADLQAAFDNSAHLKEWQANDPDRWDLAKAVDEKLVNDPVFATKTHAERLAEVERRVAAVFGDDVTTPAAPAAPAKPTPLPNSPTEIGHARTELSKEQALLEQDAGSMMDSMSGMTSAQIEALLEDAADFL